MQIGGAGAAESKHVSVAYIVVRIDEAAFIADFNAFVCQSHLTKKRSHTRSLASLRRCSQMRMSGCEKKASLCSAHTAQANNAQANSNKSYPKEFRSFWDDGPLPIVKALLKLLLHQYDVAGIMQPATHDLLQHKQSKHVSMHFRDCS